MQVDDVKTEGRHWTICPQCQGRGRIVRRLSKKARLRYQRELDAFAQNSSTTETPVRPRRHEGGGSVCSNSGLIRSDSAPEIDTENYPNIAIIGGGIGGIALAVACLHRGIPFTIYERDSCFDARSQGYGLTLQQASKAIEALGVFKLDEGVTSKKHVVHTTVGKVVGEWGVKEWDPSDARASSRRKNIHIARQSLRAALLEQLGGHDVVQWNHRLVDFKQSEEGVDLSFQVEGELKNAKADLVVGADGVRSSLRKLLIGEEVAPLRYLGCIVILGICPLDNLKGFEHSLLNSSTVFQTANGNERMYMMPYSSDAVMWQFSFPIAEEEAKALSALGSQALKDEAICRCDWHDPIPQILAATKSEQVSGYPVYDRELLEPELLAKAEKLTLIGDAAHPMSPFKGQGANQALLDALALARSITKGCRPGAKGTLREKVLTEFEAEMLERSAVKVKDSADAAEFLHSEIAIHESDKPRGQCRKG